MKQPYICIYIYIHTHMCICIYTHICIYIYIYIHICVYVYIHIYILLVIMIMINDNKTTNNSITHTTQIIDVPHPGSATSADPRRGRLAARGICISLSMYNILIIIINRYRFQTQIILHGGNRVIDPRRGRLALHKWL